MAVIPRLVVLVIVRVTLVLFTVMVVMILVVRLVLLVSSLAVLLGNNGSRNGADGQCEGDGGTECGSVNADRDGGGRVVLARVVEAVVVRVLQMMVLFWGVN